MKSPEQNLLTLSCSGRAAQCVIKHLFHPEHLQNTVQGMKVDEVSSVQRQAAGF